MERTLGRDMSVKGAPHAIEVRNCQTSKPAGGAISHPEFATDDEIAP
jgi:hypothetical protein